MSTTAIRFHPDARQELRAAVQFYEGEAAGLGRELRHEVRVVLGRISEWPASGVPEGNDIRGSSWPASLSRWSTRSWTNVVEIVAVMHQGQRPGYWEHRT